MTSNTNYIYYPKVDDEELQSKIYQKREYYGNRINEFNKDLSKYNNIKEFRDNICSGDIKYYSHQSFLNNLINPYTPYNGLLIFHGVGTGKTGSAIAISENFKNMVLKYGNKIHILVPGPLIKNNWKTEIIKFNNKNYYENIINQKGLILNKENIEKELWNINSQFYKLMSYRSFYKKVLGEKIKDPDLEKKKFRKIDGNIERDVPIDRLESLDNTLLIVDEAHNLTNNEYGLALKELIKKSQNLKILLLSATPMKNLGDDIIELINFIRPLDSQLVRDKVFNTPKFGYLLDLKKDGLDYLKKYCSGYISYYRGAHPLLFAKQVDMGEKPKELKFTKLIKCQMNSFQLKHYNIIKENIDDALEKSSQAVANFVFPGLNQDSTDIIGLHGIEGFKKLKNQLDNNKDILLKLINKKFFDNKVKELDNILYYNEYSGNFRGMIYKLPYIKNFSSKFYTLLNNLNNLVNEKSNTAFIYSNLVKSGIDLITEILLENGYLEYKEDQNYEILDNTKDYLTGKEYKNFKDKSKFKPSTFLKITGQINENETNDIEIKKRIIDNVYNNINNLDGKNLKFILGSKVMNEGITLENISEIHILDVHYNLGKTYQVIGRGIRQCKHYNITNESNPFPEVKVYKYVIGLKDKLSSEEILYKKAEYKYLLVKKIERVLKEVSIDCPLNYNGNIFKEEVKKFKNCEEPKINKEQNVDNLCPMICDFMNCSFICNDKKLNTKYYDPKSNLYKIIKKENLDYSTFTIDFAKNEINQIKELIKKIFKIKLVFTLEEIIFNVKEQINEKEYLFDNFFVYQALNMLILKTENDFNNFTDIIYDKYNRSGYLIYINKFYIFQPFDLNEDTPIYYRQQFNLNFFPNIGINTLIKEDPDYINYKKITKSENKIEKYNFNNNEYYDNRPENIFVGIIDKSTNKQKDAKLNDIFKIRSMKDKSLQKKRGTGIPSSKGAVCGTAKDKNELLKIVKELHINMKVSDLNRDNICQIIRNHLLYLEKYNTVKDKKTYMIIPSNHPIYNFPLNLEDRIVYLNNDLNIKLNDEIKFNINKTNGGIFEGERANKYTKYEISFVNKSYYDKNIIEKLGFKLKNDKWFYIVE